VYKLLISFFSLLLLSITGISQTAYWQQEVNYSIDVSLNDHDHTLNGFEKIIYTNHSPDTLHFIWFHCWPNAYKNDRTAYSDQDLENGNTAFYFSTKEDKGYINRLDFRVNNASVTVTDHPQYIDIIKVILPSPLAPGQQITITTPFQEKLPYNFSRGGHDGESYQVSQWFPKPAVYDSKGWHPMPYLDQGEFYGEFGSFDVRITLPENYVVAATGDLLDLPEKEWLLSRKNFSWTPATVKEKSTAGVIKSTTQKFPPSVSRTKTLHYYQTRIHDFAWFADKRFIVDHDTCALVSGRIIDVYTYYTPAEKDSWGNSVQFAKNAIRHYSAEVGEYPYNVVSVVQGPKSFGGGMEYPTITVISPVGDTKTLDKVIAHEVGHNWFYGILGSNERDHPWMDEGINSYYEQQYTISQYHEDLQPEKLFLGTQVFNKKDQPVETKADSFSVVNYDLVAYYKTSQWLGWIKNQLGETAFNKAMHDYFLEWQFKHPQPEDFKRSLEKSTGRSLDKEFSLLYTKGNIPGNDKRGSKFIFILDKRAVKDYIKTPSKDAMLFGPAIGVNKYDKLMAGIFFTNVKLPPTKFQYFFAPMYATGSKKATGLGFINYSFFPGKSLFRKITLGVSAETFTMSQFTDEDGNKVSLAVQKIAPSMKLIFHEKSPRSSISRYIKFQSFLFKEDGLQFSRDTMIAGPDTTITTGLHKKAENRVLNRLQFVVENNRVLYPYRGALVIDQGKDFIRAGFTGNYFFNYPKKGGLDVRLFAGKFFYTSGKTPIRQFTTDRYQLNLTGANGYEDYTYSDYFAARNDFNGFLSQQIMNRDGAFKTRTDLLASKVGKTDDWLASLNLSTTIPNEINPLSVLPVKIPLKLYADIGTYAESWKENATSDRFVYDAGIQVPLLNGLINFYLPLVYSNVFGDYYKSTIIKKERLWKKISFTVDLSGQSGKRFNRNTFF
jgi:hypothetical protein